MGRTFICGQALKNIPVLDQLSTYGTGPARWICSSSAALISLALRKILVCNTLFLVIAISSDWRSRKWFFRFFDKENLTIAIYLSENFVLRYYFLLTIIVFVCLYFKLHCISVSTFIRTNSLTTFYAHILQALFKALFYAQFLPALSYAQFLQPLF